MSLTSICLSSSLSSQTMAMVKRSCLKQQQLGRPPPEPGISLQNPVESSRIKGQLPQSPLSSSTTPVTSNNKMSSNRNFLFSTSKQLNAQQLLFLFLLLLSAVTSSSVQQPQQSRSQTTEPRPGFRQVGGRFPRAFWGFGSSAEEPKQQKSFDQLYLNSYFTYSGKLLLQYSY